MRFTAFKLVPRATVSVVIHRPAGQEILDLGPLRGATRVFQSVAAPMEPHEFSADLVVRLDGSQEKIPFEMREPVDHEH